MNYFIYTSHQQFFSSQLGGESSKDLGRIVQRLGANCPETGGESSGANCLWGELSDIRLNRHISSINNLTGKFIRVWYPNQPKTCRNYDSEDHLVKDCSSVRCLNCEQSGYRSENCKESPKCTVCRAEYHRLGDCPFALLSANVDSEGRANQGRKI